GGELGVDYHLEGGWDVLSVDVNGTVTLRGMLDRDAPGGDAEVARILAVDRGRPRLTATATLTITVTDVNDCPPSLLPPTRLHITEGSPPTKLGVLKITDPDVWALGHGPPFNISMSPSNPAHVLNLVSLKFDRRLDSGRGGAEVWTEAALDREEHRQLVVDVVVMDAEGLAATRSFTLLIDDINDNPMKPGAKTVFLWKTQGGGSEIPLGRVYVDDPDDWDLPDKMFQWVGSPHPLFSLRPVTGLIYASTNVTQNRYHLHFSVSDRVWKQQGVTANVTVVVRVLPPEALAHATPITITPTTPADFTRGWTPTEGGGGLGALLHQVLTLVGHTDHTVEVVSLHGNANDHAHAHFLNTASSPIPSSSTAVKPPTSTSRPLTTHVWISVRDAKGVYMNQVKLQGLLGLHTHQLAAATQLSVTVGHPASSSSEGVTPLHQDNLTHPSLASTDPSFASADLQIQVVDTNTTSLVTPRLTRPHDCHTQHPRQPETCTAATCFNGGRCILTSTGQGVGAWHGHGPLQLGGLAQARPHAGSHGWKEELTTHNLHGCLSHLTINAQVVDLGQPADSQGSTSGCRLQETACPGGHGGCGLRGECVGGLEHPHCECEQGWSGPDCATPTVPASLGKSSYMKVALSFRPAPLVLRVQLRVRTRGNRTGLLVHLAALHRTAAFTLHLRAGMACVSVSGAGWASRAACVEGYLLGDGAWHTVTAERHGHSLVVIVDDGDDFRRQERLAWLAAPGEGEYATGPPMSLEVDKHNGVTVGGLPEFVGGSLIKVHDDLHDTCLDDLRVSGVSLPLAPAVNSTSWGQVTSVERLESGCYSTDVCVNSTCSAPLTCYTAWDQPTCRSVFSKPLKSSLLAGQCHITWGTPYLQV
ncbi:neural-cadherin-like, partial [Cherax quadricarinatus]|uniref:neural-cadherin-like n=1 Tax=Cherax quadricarinatus TaxID=27406 RepID=UPI00387E4216